MIVADACDLHRRLKLLPRVRMATVMTVIIDDSVDGIYLFASKLSWSQLALLHAFQILFQYLPAEMPADRVFRMKKTKLSSLNNTQRAVLSRI